MKLGSLFQPDAASSSKALILVPLVLVLILFYSVAPFKGMTTLYADQRSLEGVADCVSSNSLLLNPYPIRGPLPWSVLNQELRDEYTLNGTIPIFEFMFFMNTGHYVKDMLVTYPEDVKAVWSKSYLKGYINKAKARDMETCVYGEDCSWSIFAAFDAHPVKGKDVLVVGTIDPWIEAIAYVYGAASITTVDFNVPISEMPEFQTRSIGDLDASKHSFDVIVSYSSIEHDGLGRYGDPLHPHADLMRMQQLRRFLRATGKLYLGVPMGMDRLEFNAHRVYGPVRYPMLVRGYKVRDVYFDKVRWDLEGILEKLKDSGSYAHQPMSVLTLS